MRLKRIVELYKDYICFERSDQAAGIPFIFHFVTAYREHNSPEILDRLLTFHDGADRDDIKEIVLFLTLSEFSQGRFKFRKLKPKDKARYEEPPLLPSFQGLTYRHLRQIIEDGSYHAEYLRRTERAEQKRKAELRSAEDAIERDRRKLRTNYSGPIGNSVRTVSGGLPSLGKKR
ncbi:hypothetical protein Q4543_23070 [Salipiger sp. 1_MG-2023]|uniref:hypothetical protein n=1 Tax=Salipiger sp. 1_MG-2023 TaxID=3062665 RepID=UPI0026E31A49|nr:hypothetical protein [Salipiger sp. 1_MG-2023]MDO6588376.1 hypothetical protein [Salipiger sp. 1_MG-2023]